MAKHDVWSVQAWLGYLFEKEVIELQRLAREALEMGSPTVVNIGAGGGTSGLLFAEILGENGYLYTVDIQDESSPFGCLAGERDVFNSAGLDHLANRHWFQIHGDSAKVGKEWDKGDVDIVFVDGNHTLIGCMSDIANWWPHLRVGGVMAIHDYGKGDIDFQAHQASGGVVPHPKDYPGVDTAVQRMLFDFRGAEQVSRVESLITFRKIDEADIV